MFSKNLIEFFYLVSSVLLILGLRFLTHSNRARLGNLLISSAMGIAVLSSLLETELINLGWIFSAIIIGSVMGILSSSKVRLTSAPQLLAFYNGLGGAAVTITSYIAFIQLPIEENKSLLSIRSVFIFISIFLGLTSFSGSITSIIKFRNILPESGISFPLQKLLNFFTLIAILATTTFILAKSEPDHYLLYLMMFLSVMYGIFFFMPLGGFDSPIAISFLNSYSGISLIFSGAIYSNQIMLVSGLVVGLSSIVLSVLFAKSTKRSIFKILLGGSNYNSPSPFYHLGMQAREITISDAAILLKYAKKILIIPGYGMGISQTQYSCKELEDLLSESNVDVKYLVHPYAGRMPGHINILLSEANVSYHTILSVDDVNKMIHNFDVVLCIGANDIINPFIDRDKKSPLYGIPKINLKNAKHVIILKRSLQPGFSGLENQIFFETNTKLILGNIKSILLKLITEVREL